MPRGFHGAGLASGSGQGNPSGLPRFPSPMSLRFLPQLPGQAHLTQSFVEDVLQKSIPTQIRQLVLLISNSKVQGDGLVEELTSAERPEQHLV